MCPKQPLEAKTDVDHQIANKYRMLINVPKTTPEKIYEQINAHQFSANILPKPFVDISSVQSFRL